MVEDLSGLEQLIGGALGNTFGVLGIPIFALLFFAMVSVALRTGWEVTMTFIVALVLILAINYGLNQIIVGLIIVGGSLIIWLALSRVLRL